ncbi:MAG: signal peptidase I [Oscillospiraceae bacterium]|nr:signal peptidase I [Oscillospiraceae bacterium]
MDSNETTKSKIIDELIEWIETLLFSFLTIILLFTFVLRTSEVNGPSMYPTFVGRDDSIGQSGDMLIYLSCLTEFDNGDVVVVNSVAFDEPIIKRVIAKPGQTVTVDYEIGAVYVDGVEIDEPYINEPTYTGSARIEYPITLGEGEYFIMGDNRNHSSDSRFIGPVTEEEIFGKVIFRIAPIDKIGVVGNE